MVDRIGSSRFNLSSMIVLKDNYIWSSASITAVIVSARKVDGFRFFLMLKYMTKTKSSRPSRLVSTSSRLRAMGKIWSLGVCVGVWTGMETVPAQDGQGRSQTESNVRERATTVAIDISSTSSECQSYCTLILSWRFGCGQNE